MRTHAVLATDSQKPVGLHGSHRAPRRPDRGPSPGRRITRVSAGPTRRSVGPARTLVDHHGRRIGGRGMRHVRRSSVRTFLVLEARRHEGRTSPASLGTAEHRNVRTSADPAIGGLREAGRAGDVGPPPPIGVVEGWGRTDAPPGSIEAIGVAMVGPPLACAAILTVALSPDRTAPAVPSMSSPPE